MKHIYYISWIVTLLALQGCAAMFSGTKSDVSFLSEPSGAVVTIDDEEIGTTPFSAEISKKAEEATFHHPDYPARTVSLERSVMGGYVLMDLLFTPGFGLSGLLIDGGTGAWYKHAPIASTSFGPDASQSMAKAGR